MMEYPVIAREVARRLRENDAHGDEAQLREMGAQAIEQLCELADRQQRLIARCKAALADTVVSEEDTECQCNAVAWAGLVSLFFGPSREPLPTCPVHPKGPP